MPYLTPGMKIIFGLDNGAKTNGTVLKINRVKCKVRQDEIRNSHPINTIWNVPSRLIETTEGKRIDNNWQIVDSLPQRSIINVTPSDNTMPSELWINQNEHELNILERIYNCLSPENLACDGEISYSQIIAKRNKLNKELGAVFVLMDRRMDEDTCFKCMEILNKKDNELEA